MARAAAWQIAAAVSSSACVKVRSAPLSTSSTVPITRSLTISGSVAQLMSAQSLLSSRTAGVSRGSRSDPTTAGRFVSITSRVTAASARGRRCPIQRSSISPPCTRISVCRSLPSITAISHSPTPMPSHRRRAVVSSVACRSRLLVSSSADSLTSAMRRRLSSSCR